MSTVGTQHEPCEECGAPLDPQQRYCVNCAARRGNGANPSSRYFATMSQRARRPAARPPAKAGPGSRAAAVGSLRMPIARDAWPATRSEGEARRSVPTSPGSVVGAPGGRTSSSPA